MSEILDRRMLLKGAAATAAAMSPLADAFGAQAAGLQFDPPVPFTYELFKTQARDRAHGPYIPPSRPAPMCCRRSITRNGEKSDTATNLPYSPMGRANFR